MYMKHIIYTRVIKGSMVGVSVRWIHVIRKKFEVIFGSQ